MVDERYIAFDDRDPPVGVDGEPVQRAALQPDGRFAHHVPTGGGGKRCAQHALVRDGNHGLTARGPTELGFMDERGGIFRVMSDIEGISARIARESKDIPHFILGHSMGSFMVQGFHL